MTAIGLSGYAQSGKTTAAKYLEEKYGFKRRHIADPLRAMLAVLLRANGLNSEMIGRYLEGDLKESVIPELGVTSRYAQITIGTEWGRELINPDLWANTWMRGVTPGEKIMNDSVRFVNEQDVIQKDLSGFTLMIKRPGTVPAKFKWGWLGKVLFKMGLMFGVHDSERIDRLKPDYVIQNDGSLEDLYGALDKIVDDWSSKGKSKPWSKEDSDAFFASAGAAALVSSF